LWGARAVSSEFWPFTEYSNPNAEEGNRLKVHKPKKGYKEKRPNGDSPRWVDLFRFPETPSLTPKPEKRNRPKV